MKEIQRMKKEHRKKASIKEKRNIERDKEARMGTRGQHFCQPCTLGISDERIKKHVDKKNLTQRQD